MNTVCIDLQALRHNYQQLQAKIGSERQLMAVVKADGYGHGMIEVARVLQAIGAHCFGVGTVVEGKRLRLHGITGRIVVLLGGCGESIADLSEYDLEPVVSNRVQLARLQEQATSGLAIHVKVDCGMGRLGFASDEIVQVCTDIMSSSLVIAGLMSHFPVADEDRSLTLAQAHTFAKIVKDVRALGVQPLAHMANSAAILGDIAVHDMARVGISLYGCFPATQFASSSVALQPVMTVKSTVLQVKPVPAGTGVSYGLTQQTKRDSLLAVVGIGYADGYPRMLSECGAMLIGGKRAPIMGRVCMNMTVVDVTDLDTVKCGDDVIVLGKQGADEISATDIADWAGTINYEILCTLGNLSPKVFLHELLTPYT